MKAELLYPQSGIDKVKCLISPSLINKETLTWKNDTHGIDPYNNVCLEANGIYHFLIVNAEAFSLKGNYEEVIIDALNKCIALKYLFTPPEGSFSFSNINDYITVTELEFNFDFPLWAIQSNCNFVTFFREEAHAQHLYYYHVHKYEEGIYELSECLYSGDYIRNSKSSSVCFYNKTLKNLSDHNKCSIDKLLQHPYPLRLEFRLNTKNCNILQLDLLNGSYIHIFHNYLPYLGKIHNEWVRPYFSIMKNINSRYERVTYMGDILQEGNIQRITSNISKRIKKVTGQ